MTIVLANPESVWMKKSKEILTKYGIHEDELKGSKARAKHAIQTGVHIKFCEKMTKAKEERSKLKFFLEGKNAWKPEKPAEYMLKLTRKQASTIFKARTRMTKVKGNYKNGYSNHNCRACKQATETQGHVLNECQKLLTRPPPATPTPDNDALTNHDDDNTNNNLTGEITDPNPMTNHDNEIDIFSEDPEPLKQMAKFVDEIMSELMMSDK